MRENPAQVSAAAAPAATAGTLNPLARASSDVLAEGQQQQRFRHEEEHLRGREPDDRDREQHEDGAARNTFHLLAWGPTPTPDALAPSCSRVSKTGCRSTIWR